MNFRGLTVTGAAMLAVLASCASPMQRSAPLSQQYLAANPLTKESKAGIPYFLPDTVVPVTVSGDFVLLPGRKADDATPADYEYVISVSIGAAKQVPDSNAALMLEYVPEMASDDVFKLNVGANGLLSNVKSTSSDQSAAIILKLVELAKEAITLPSKFGKTMRTAPAGPSDADRRIACYSTLQKMSVTTEINLSDFLRLEGAYSYLSSAARSGPDGWAYNATTAADQELADQYARYLGALLAPDVPFSLGATAAASGNFQNSAAATHTILAKQKDLLNRSALLAMQKRPSGTQAADRPIRTMSFAGKPRFPVPGSVSSTPPHITPGAKAYTGIVFRTMAPRQLYVAVDTEGLQFGGCVLRSVAAHAESSTLMVADPIHTFVADNNRGVFVKKRVDFAVTDGVLTGIEVDKPSELLAIVSLPVDILKAIAAIPGEILTVKIKQLSDEKGLTAAQVELLKAQIDLIKQRQALADAQKEAQ